MKETAFSRNFNALFDFSGKTQDELAAALGVDRVTIYNWRNGRTSKPKSQEIIDKLKDYFNVTETDLFGYADGYYAKKYGLTERPAGAMAPNPEPRRAYAPLLGRVHAGDAGEPDILDSKIPLPYEIWEHHKNGYFLEVEGTCMNRVYSEGCYVFVDPDKTPCNRSIAVVSIDDVDYIMRRLYIGSNSLMLVAESFDEWEDIIIQGEQQVKMVGTVVWFQSREELE